MKTLYFAAPGFDAAARGHARAARGTVGKVAVARFANGELQASLGTPVRGRRCAVVCSVAPPAEDLFAACLVIDALRRGGARRITVVAPYLAYARQDRAEKGKSLGVALVGAMIRAAGADAVETFDVHSADAAKLLGVTVVSRPVAEAMAAALGRRVQDAVVVAPDRGAIPRAEAFRRAAGVARPIAFLEKTRTAAGVAHGALVGSLASRAIIVDDILDTGGTLVSCARRLRLAGVREMFVVVTHGLFTGVGWKRLRRSGVRRIFVGDSVPLPRRARGPDVEVVRLLS